MYIYNICIYIYIRRHSKSHALSMIVTLGRLQSRTHAWELNIHALRFCFKLKKVFRLKSIKISQLVTRDYLN